MTRTREVRKAAGICTDCGKQPPRNGRLTCEPCGAIAIARSLAQQGSWRAAGRCKACGRAPAPDRTRCDKCGKAENARISRLQAKKRVLIAAAKARPCVDCGKQYPPVAMDLDHVRDTKRFAVGQGVNQRSIADIVAEIAKCDVRCANCHRIITAKRQRTRTTS